MAQIKKIEKFADGGEASSVTKAPAVTSPKYKFKVDNNDYEVDDNTLDSAFNTAYQKLVDNGYARKNDREDWNKRYQIFKEQAKSGVYNIDMQGDQVGGLSYQGGALNAENSGLNEKGETANSNFVGRLFGGVDDGDKQMALLNNALGKSIGAAATGKFAQDKIDTDQKAKETEAKLKLEKTGEDSKFINKYKILSNPGTSLYGDQGDDAWRLSEYWKQKTGQTGMYAKSLNGLFSYVQDSKFDDPELQKSFKAATGKDINELRGHLKTYGYDKNNFETGFNFDKTYNLRNQFGLLATDENYISKDAWKKGVAATNAANGTGAPATEPVEGAPKPLTQQGKFWTNGNQIFNDKEGTSAFQGVNNGIYYKNGSSFTGVSVDNPNDDASWENKQSGFFINGKSASKALFEQHLSKTNNEELNDNYKNTIGQINKSRTDLFARMADQSPFTASGTGSNYAFKDLQDKGVQPEKAEEISGLFTKYFNNPNFRLYQYKVKGKDKFGEEGLIRHRITQNGNKYDGILKQDVSGNYFLLENNGTKHVLGQADGSITQQRENPFYLKTGGSLTKLQIGGLINKQISDGAASGPQSTQYRSATGSNMYKAATDKNYNLSDSDKWLMGGLLADVTGLGFSLTGAGSIAGAAAGAAGTTANLVSNIKRDGLGWDDVGQAALGYGLDAVTAVPGLGIVGSTGKVVKNLRRAATTLGVAFGAYGAYAAAGSLAKLDNPSQMTIDDWKNITVGIQSVLSGKRMADHAFATTKVTSNTIKANGKNIVVDAGDFNKVKTAKTPEDKILFAKEAILKSGSASKLGIKSTEDIKFDFDVKKSMLNKASFGKLGKTSDELNLSTSSNGVALKNYDDSNWYVKRAIKNTANQNPTMPGANQLMGKRFVANQAGDGSYDQVSNWQSGWGFLGNKTRMRGNPMTEGSYSPNSVKDPVMNPVPGKAAEVVDGVFSTRLLNQADGNTAQSTNLKDAVLKRGYGPVENRYSSLKEKTAPLPKKTTDPSTDNFEAAAKANSEYNVKSVKDVRVLLGAEDGGNKQLQTAIGKILNKKLASATDAEKINKIVNGEHTPGSQMQKMQNKLIAAFDEYSKGGKTKGLKKVTLKQGGVIPKFQNSGMLQRLQNNIKPVNVKKSTGLNQLQNNIKPFNTGINLQNGYNPPSLGHHIKMQNDPFGKALNVEANKIANDTSQVWSNYNNAMGIKQPLAPMPSNAQRNPTRASIGRQQPLNRTVTDRAVAAKQRLQLPQRIIDPNMIEDPTIAGLKAPNKASNFNVNSIYDIKSPTNNSSQLGNAQMKEKGEGFKFKPDLNTASELARALFVRNNNKNLDYEIKPTILQNVLETPNQVKGDLYTKSLFDDKANKLQSSGSRATTSDGALEVAKMLSVNEQADQIRSQGISADVDALNRSKGLNEQLNQSYAQGRQAIANQNIQARSRTDEANRQSNNMKMGAMNQPIDSFWAAQNQKGLINEQRNELFDSQLSQLDNYNSMSPYRTQLISKIDDIDRKITAAGNTDSSALVAERANLSKQADQIKTKQQYAQIMQQRDPKYVVPANYYEYDANWNPRNSITSRKSGGTFDAAKEETKYRRELLKENGKNARDLVRSFNSWSASKARNETIEKISSSKNLNEIIKLALK